MTNEKTVLHYCGRPINELPREELEEAFAELFSDYTDLNKEVSRRRKEAFAGRTNGRRSESDAGGPAVSASRARADRILDEFTEGAYRGERHTSIRHGLARVLRHLADTEAGYADEESWYAVPANTLTDLADALEVPTLLERALAGDAQAARQFLHEGGFTDEHGNLLPHLRPCQD